jgi:pumilio family protein 6
MNSPSIRPAIIEAITPHLQPLIFHTFACSVIADFFELYATPKEKRLLVRGFYPREVQIFDGAKGEKGLEALLEETTEQKSRERILEQLEKTVIEM